MMLHMALYITEEDVPHSIFECEGARTCAIELRSFLRMPDLQEYVLAQQSFRKTLSVEM